MVTKRPQQNVPLRVYGILTVNGMLVLQERATSLTDIRIRASLSLRFIERACRSLPKQEVCRCLGSDSVAFSVVGFRHPKSPHGHILAAVVAGMSLKNRISFSHYLPTSFLGYTSPQRCHFPVDVASCGWEMEPVSLRPHQQKHDFLSRRKSPTPWSQKTWTHLPSPLTLTA